MLLTLPSSFIPKHGQLIETRSFAELVFSLFPPAIFREAVFLTTEITTKNIGWPESEAVGSHSILQYDSVGNGLDGIYFSSVRQSCPYYWPLASKFSSDSCPIRRGICSFCWECAWLPEFGYGKWCEIALDLTDCSKVGFRLSSTRSVIINWRPSESIKRCEFFARFAMTFWS